MMMVLQIVAALGSYGVELVVHLIDTEHRLQTAFVERAVVLYPLGTDHVPGCTNSYSSLVLVE